MADHTIKVLLKPDGSPTCGPNEVPGVRRGDRLIWSGPSHKGVMEGKIKGPKQHGFTEAEFKDLHADNAIIPTTVDHWNSGDILHVKPDAQPGAYKYSITLTPSNKTVDPIIIIDP